MAVRADEVVARPGRPLKISLTNTVHLEECPRVRQAYVWPGDGVMISVEEIPGRLGQTETVGRCCLKPVSDRVEKTRAILEEIGRARGRGEGEGLVPTDTGREAMVSLAADLVRRLEA